MTTLPLNLKERRIMDRRDDIETNPILTQILQQYNSINENLIEFKDEYRPYLDFIKEEYAKRKRRKEIWDKVIETVLGWAVIAFITSIAGIIGYIGHYFWQLIKQDIGLR